MSAGGGQPLMRLTGTGVEEGAGVMADTGVMEAPGAGVATGTGSGSLVRRASRTNSAMVGRRVPAGRSGWSKTELPSGGISGLIKRHLRAWAVGVEPTRREDAKHFRAEGRVIPGSAVPPQVRCLTQPVAQGDMTRSCTIETTRSQRLSGVSSLGNTGRGSACRR